MAGLAPSDQSNAPAATPQDRGGRDLWQSFTISSVVSEESRMAEDVIWNVTRISELTISSNSDDKRRDVPQNHALMR